MTGNGQLMPITSQTSEDPSHFPGQTLQSGNTMLKDVYSQILQPAAQANCFANNWP